MASHAFYNWQVMPRAGQRPELTLVPPLFADAEYQVIELARRDSIWSIRPHSWPVRIVGQLFGIRVANPLADPQLEAVRRFVVTANTGDKRAIDTEYRQFQDAGFSPAHADYIIQRMSEKLPLSQR